MNRLSYFFIAVLLLSGMYLFFAPPNAQFAAEVPTSFNSYSEMMEYHNRLEIPGYGSSTGGLGTITPWGQFTFFSVEIPNRHKFQVFIYSRKNETAPYLFIEHFMLEDTYPPMLEFVAQDEQLVYQYQGKGEILSRESIIPN